MRNHNSTVFQDQTNRVLFPRKSSICQLDECLTSLAVTQSIITEVDEHPYPTVNFQPQNLEPNKRRLERYSAAESTLSTTFQQCQIEHQPRELQIKALQTVTSHLRAHAEDARSHAEKLRKALVDRAIDPETYSSMQRRRWMEERREIVVKSQIKSVSDHLSILITSPESVKEDVRHHQASWSIASHQDANILRFFNVSHKVPLRHRRTTFLTGTKPMVHERRHFRNLLPLKILKKRHSPSLPWEPSISASPEPPEMPDTPLDGEQQTPTNSPSLKDNLAVHDIAVPLDPAHPSVRLSTPEDSDNGTVTIYPTLFINRPEDIADKITVNIPDYVEELLRNFDVDHNAGLPSTLVTGLPSHLKPPRRPDLHKKSTLLHKRSFRKVPTRQSTTEPPPVVHQSPRKRTSAILNYLKL